MRVLGIDPGLVATGYGVVESERGDLRHIASGTITIPASRPLSARLRMLYDSLGEICSRYDPAEVAVENTFLAKNVAVALKLGQARGIALLVAELAQLPISEYAPTEIKIAVTGFGGAAKEQVQLMVGRLLRLSVETTTHHATDALAAAICHLHSGPWRRIVARPREVASRTL
ncbi:MAG: crossover junction endodeoxyribonuclease RuvC [Nitrospirae bacterium]|nr:crossover junction endodeoxyribonuclease RuvC [Nitrospirota bacterium]